MLSTKRRRWVVFAAVAASVLAAPPLFLMAVGLIYDWEHWRELAAARACERIQVGMSRQQVDQILGSPGEETDAEHMPGFPPYAHDPAAPPGWNGCVWGDTFVHWRFGQADVYIGFSDGRVTSKYFWMPSF